MAFSSRSLVKNDMDEAFKSGQIVRNVVPVYGEVLAYDPQKTNQEPTLNPGKSGGPGARHGETVEIPVGHTGEVLSSTDFETVVIYPIHSTGELEPHMVRVESFTSDFKRTRRHNPFKLDRSDYEDPGRPIKAKTSALDLSFHQHWSDSFGSAEDGEYHEIITAHVPNEERPVGYIKTSFADDELRILHVEVAKPYQRNGVATELLNYIVAKYKHDYPDVKVQHTMQTDEGASWVDSLKGSSFKWPADVSIKWTREG